MLEKLLLPQAVFLFDLYPRELYSGMDTTETQKKDECHESFINWQQKEMLDNPQFQ